ncbi:MAG: SCO family protein [Acidimicrobiales bacterium]|nr:SCO family protein [Acidimicrobiales bacterium]HRW39589.1 SCO family protein [Aquihabitans sp.]
MLLGAVLAFAVLQPIKVLPRIRLAPGYALHDQHGDPLTSETARGSITLYSFAPLDCGERCDDVFATLREVRERARTEVDLGDVDLQLVTVALADDPTAEQLAAAAAASGADGEVWRWAGGDVDRIRTLVGAGFRRYVEFAPDGTVEFDPGFVLVDGAGVVRAELRYQTESPDADRLVRRLGVLGDELRLAHGPAAAAYEAAHLFLCYA